MTPAWQPEVDGGRCVQSRLDNASCRACIQACPHQAWQLTDDALNLDTGACDGCGLCAPACPESAIALPFRPVTRYGKDNRPILLAACEKSQVENGADVLPCVYSLGSADLLAAWQRGMRQAVLVTGDCQSCPRNRKAEWTAELESLRVALRARNAEGLDVQWATADAWAGYIAMPGQPATSRRGFLRGALAGLADKALDEEESAAARPLGTRLPPGLGPVPWAVTLDRERCNACLLCTRLCAHGALMLEESGGELELQVHSLRCTGCRLCLDVCEPGALQLSSWQLVAPQSQQLATHDCPCCRARFHVPAGRENPGLCPTCQSLRRPDPRKPLVG
jgi:ferredoxin